MKSILGIFYLFLFFSYIATALFIVFHIVRYSMSKASMIFGLVLFLSVFITLALTNIALFFALPIDALIPKNF